VARPRPHRGPVRGSHEGARVAQHDVPPGVRTHGRDGFGGHTPQRCRDRSDEQGLRTRADRACGARHGHHRNGRRPGGRERHRRVPQALSRQVPRHRAVRAGHDRDGGGAGSGGEVCLRHDPRHAGGRQGLGHHQVNDLLRGSERQHMRRGCRPVVRRRGRVQTVARGRGRDEDAARHDRHRPRRRRGGQEGDDRGGADARTRLRSLRRRESADRDDGHDAVHGRPGRRVQAGRRRDDTRVRGDGLRGAQDRRSDADRDEPVAGGYAREACPVRPRETRGRTDGGVWRCSQNA